MTVRAVRTHRRDHLPDQLVGQLLLAAIAVQTGQDRGLHVTHHGLAVHPRLPGHAPLALTRRPGAQDLPNLDHIALVQAAAYDGAAVLAVRTSIDYHADPVFAWARHRTDPVVTWARRRTARLGQ